MFHFAWSVYIKVKKNIIRLSIMRISVGRITCFAPGLFSLILMPSLLERDRQADISLYYVFTPLLLMGPDNFYIQYIHIYTYIIYIFIMGEKSVTSNNVFLCVILLKKKVSK